ncbi:MAG: PRC-barrel domain containing protein [Actinomycetota bacterium]|nr:PRC-barrel domain containing protein [Actinomycetota bacterium]
MSTVDMWGYPDEAAGGRDLTGYAIEALDGGIGKVDKANNEAAASWLIVDTGPWIFGKKVMLPAGVVARINSESEVVHVNRTKEEIKNAPEFDEGRDQEQGYRDELGGYYGTGGRGYRE